MVLYLFLELKIICNHSRNIFQAKFYSVEEADLDQAVLKGRPGWPEESICNLELEIYAVGMLTRMCDTSNGYFLLLKFSLFCEKVRHGVQYGKLPSALICVGILLAVISSHYTWSGPDGEAQNNFCSRRAVAAQQHQQQHVCSDLIRAVQE